MNPSARGKTMTQYQMLGERDKFISMSQQMSNWARHVLGTSYHEYRSAEAWAPAINIYEDETHYSVVVDLAGMKADGIDLRVEEGVMIISGQRDSPGLRETRGAKRVHLMEIDHGQFTRRIELPEDVEVDAVQQASYRNGFLWIRLTKRS